MQMSHSRVSTFKQCPFKFKLSYLDGLTTMFNLDPTNALVLGTAMHEGIEKDVESAIQSYYSNYPTATPLMVNEAIKLEVMVKKAKDVLSDLLENGQFEVEVNDPDFLGFVDLLVQIEPNIYDLYDFKYSNNVDSYVNSSQLHLYKYFLEKHNPEMKIRNLGFIFVPKVKLKQETDDIHEYRRMLIEECEKQEISIVPIEYDPMKVIDFMIDVKHLVECEDFVKKPQKLCYWCDFKTYCQSDGKLDGNIIYPKEDE